MKKKRNFLRGSLAVLLTGVATPAWAIGTNAGTLIENTAEASYASGSSSITVKSNTVTIKVDEVLDVAVASNSVSQPSPDKAVFAFVVTNTGNGSEAFNLNINTAVAGNEFEFLVDEIVIDDGDGIYEPGIDTVLPAGSPIPALDADKGVTVFVLGSLPEEALDGQVSTIELKAEAVTGIGEAGTSFEGKGEGGGDAVVGTTTATQVAPQSVTASLATVTLTKSAAIADQFGGEEAIPGAIVTYSIVAEIVGSGEITGLNVTDVIPAGTLYSKDSLLLDGKKLTDADDADGGQATQETGIDVSLGTVGGGTSYTVTFQVTIS